MSVTVIVGLWSNRMRMDRAQRTFCCAWPKIRCIYSTTGLSSKTPGAIVAHLIHMRAGRARTGWPGVMP